MKKFLIILVIILLLAAAGYYYLKPLTDKSLSSSQQEIVDTFGYPSRFTLSYLPQGEGEGGGLVRQETWVYPDHQTEIVFLGGNVVTVNEIAPDEGTVNYVDLKPSDFDFDTTYEDMAEALGDKKIEPADVASSFFEKDVLETYVSDQVVFTLEAGYLTYLQTIGVAEQ